MQTSVLKVLIDISSANCDSDKVKYSENALKLFWELPRDEYFQEIKYDSFKGAIEKQWKQFCHCYEDYQKDSVKNITFHVFNNVFFVTNQRERFQAWESIVNYAYDSLVQYLAQSKLHSLIMTKPEYKSLVRDLLPFVKLNVALKSLELPSKNTITLKSMLQELNEHIVSPVLSREDCYEIIAAKLGTNDVDLISFEVDYLDSSMGFMGEYAKLKILVCRFQKEETHKFFIKLVPQVIDELRGGWLKISVRKEAELYLRFIALARKLGFEKVSKFAPECYLQSQSFLAFEDAAVDNYQSPPLVDLDYKHLSIAFKEMAKLHSTSLLVEHKLATLTGTKKTLDKYFPEMLTEMFIHDSSDPFTACNLRSMQKEAARFPEIVKDMSMEEFQNRIKTHVYSKIYSGFRKSKKYVNVICNGDVWWKNMMFKWDGNKNPTACYLIDFQMCRYVPPALELLVLTQVCTNIETRQKYLPKLLDEYYNHVKTNLEQYEVNIEEVFPYNDFISSVDELKPCAVYIATQNRSVIFIPSERLEKMKSSPEEALHFYTVEKEYLYDEVWNQMPLHRIREDFQELYWLCLKD
ncbi:unnamed protein product [Diabrotica balteata]|uniref:CHK kinase-like domain-containing protein n=1 Tax=Diabrotica balteata TaxID=107213 RepID=A0A9N9X795_DIABA|nr:unnamed protein product [Diabrotica balteata]